jgi:ketosteroid isomerase-like protein
MQMTTLPTRILAIGILLSTQIAHAQNFSGKTAGLDNTPNGKIIKAWYTAWQIRDWNLMTQSLADGFTFSSPMDDHIKLDAMKERCWPNAGNIKSVEVTQMIMNGDEVIVIANATNSGGKFFRNCDYFKLKDGKIAAYECFFGPGINYPNSGK